VTFCTSKRRFSVTSAAYINAPANAHRGFQLFLHLYELLPSMNISSLPSPLLKRQIQTQFLHRMGSTSPPSPPRAGFRTLVQCRSLAISEAEDDPEIRKKYRPFLLPEDIEAKDWISELELESVVRIAEEDLARTQSRLMVLVLYGSLRQR
jgi:hypothetical protein